MGSGTGLRGRVLQWWVGADDGRWAVAGAGVGHKWAAPIEGLLRVANPRAMNAERMGERSVVNPSFQGRGSIVLFHPLNSATQLLELEKEKIREKTLESK